MTLAHKVSHTGVCTNSSKRTTQLAFEDAAQRQSHVHSVNLLNKVSQIERKVMILEAFDGQVP